MIRKVLFWLHLGAGVVAGLVILTMSVTGVALTYERQLNQWTTDHLRSQPPAADSKPLPVETLLAEVARTHRDIAIAGVTIGARSDAPVVLAAEPAPVYVDAYSARDLGERRGTGLREFLSTMRAWHRWLAVEGDGRPLARALTGWSNLLFLFIVASGVYLWLPRIWNWTQVKQVLFFRRQYGSGKARDFNWHNVIGVWSAIPLFVVVLGAVPISFPWATDLVYRVVGEEPPARGRPGGPGGRPPGGPGAGPAGRGTRGEGTSTAGPGSPGNPGNADAHGSRSGGEGNSNRAPAFDGLNAMFSRAIAEQPDWRTISVRLPRRADEPFAFNIDRGDGGQPQLRSTLTLTRAGDVVSRERFADQSTGRQVRSVLRFAHTGEVLGLTGQTIAGLVSAGAVVMVWTGLALSFRRCRAWLVRRRDPAASPRTVAAR